MNLQVMQATVVAMRTMGSSPILQSEAWPSQTLVLKEDFKQVMTLRGLRAEDFNQASRLTILQFIIPIDYSGCVYTFISV